MLCAHVVTTATILAAGAAVALWLERQMRTHTLDRWDRIQIWALRAAGLLLAAMLILPVHVFGQNGSTIADLQQRATTNALRIESLDGRLDAIEGLHLETQLATLQAAADDVRAIKQWLLGIAAALLVSMVSQVLTLVRTKRG